MSELTDLTKDQSLRTLGVSTVKTCENCKCSKIIDCICCVKCTAQSFGCSEPTMWVEDEA